MTSSDDLLTVRQVQGRYGFKDARAARKVMKAAGALRPLGNTGPIFVRRSVLLRWERSLEKKAGTPEARPGRGVRIPPGRRLWE